RLNAARQDARELRTTILIKQGDLERAVTAATRLTTDAPLREASWALLMRALYAAGRPVESLREYERFRALLARELGLDPSPGLRDLHTAILRHDIDVLGSDLGPRVPDRLTAAPVPRPPALPPLVGRAEETAQLDGLLRAASAGSTQWAVVSGAEGTGKTRLLDELAVRAAAAGLPVVRVDGGGVGSDGRSAGVCPVLQLLDLLRQRNAGGEANAASPSEPEPVAALVRELGRAPTLCLVDDLDEATQETYGRLRRLAALSRDTPAAVVCTLRDTGTPEVSGLLADLARRGTAWLHLEPLTAGDVCEMLAAAGEDPAGAEALHRRGAGNPFALTELLKLTPDQRSGPGSRVPPPLSTIVHDRLARVSTQVRTALTHTAVDGGRLDLDLLTEVQGVPRDLLPPLVDAAVTAELLVWHPDGGDPAAGHYRLPELVHEVLLGTLTPSARQLLHAALARALTGRDDTCPARLAGHLRAAGPLAPAATPPVPRGTGTEPSAGQAPRNTDTFPRCPSLP
ncbi:BTAD domain-containing putative transcriptional regulator, partial [Streptomyces sp. NPDC055078]